MDTDNNIQSLNRAQTDEMGKDEKSKERSQNSRGGESDSRTNKISSAPKKPSMKDLSKAERRAIQEKQRAEKAALKGNSSNNPKQQQQKHQSNNNNPQKQSNNESNQNRTLQSSERKSNPNQSSSSNHLPQSFQLFLHLDLPPTIDSLLESQRSDQLIHHSILRLARLYAEFKIVGSNARCLAMLEAFKPVIQSYSPPQGTSLSRNLPSYLSHQINHLVQARPLSVSMGNSIRHLKAIISRISLDEPDDKAKQQLCDRIDLFIRDRIIFADKVIQSYATQKINDGDVIMTYSNSSVIQGVLSEAHRQGINFSVIVVDSSPTYEGKNMLKFLMNLNSSISTRGGGSLGGLGLGGGRRRSGKIELKYVLINSIGSIIRKVKILMIGAHSILANGSIYSRSGTALICMICKFYRIPVLCCCETYKFSERVMLDSIVSNEISTSQSTIPPSSFHHLFKFQSILPQPRSTTMNTTENNEPINNNSSNKNKNKNKKADCKDDDDLEVGEDEVGGEEKRIKELSLLYDVTRPEDVTMVITEAGIIPVQSVPVLLRDYKPLVAE